jgi:hypothetical protein
VDGLDCRREVGGVVVFERDRGDGAVASVLPYFDLSGHSFDAAAWDSVCVFENEGAEREYANSGFKTKGEDGHDLNNSERR